MTRRWPPTSPEAMNLRGASLDASGTRFADCDPGPGYRPFFAYSEYPGGPVLRAERRAAPQELVLTRYWARGLDQFAPRSIYLLFRSL